MRAASARNVKVQTLAELLRGVSPAETPAVVAWLSGELTQRQIGVGWAALRDLPPPAAEPALEVAQVEEAFTRIGALAGPGSQAARRDAVRDLLARATEAEQRFLVALLLGDLGQGALAGVMADAVAKAAGVPLADVRRALMLRGDLGAVAAVALADGSPGLARIALELLRPVQPMLAAPGDDLDAALERISPAAVEFKLDGVRVQVHRRGDEVRVFSRTLDDVTARVPEVVRAALALPADTLVLDGEAIALRRGRAAGAVPGDREPLRHAAPGGRGTAHGALLRRAARGRRGPARPPGIGALRRARRPRPGAGARPAGGGGRRRGRRRPCSTTRSRSATRA